MDGLSLAVASWSLAHSHLQDGGILYRQDLDDWVKRKVVIMSHCNAYSILVQNADSNLLSHITALYVSMNKVGKYFPNESCRSILFMSHSNLFV
jgi:hypothetical protein